VTETHSIHIKVDSTDAQKATRNLSDMEKATNGAERALTNLTRAAVGLVALDKIGNVAKGILDTNRAMEALRAQLVAVTGSAVGAQRAFSFIQNFATSTPYEIDGLTKAFIMLQNYGIKPTKQVMEAVTNQASKLGASQETLDGIVRALGQAYAKGKLQAEEMLQLAERGVPVYDLLSQVTGKNAAQLQEMASKGELTRQTIEKLIATMNQAASGANAAAMDTLNGKISNLSDAWHQFEDALLNDKSEGIIKDIVDGITAQINRMTASINMNPVQKLEAQLASLRKTPGYDVPIAEVERQLEIAKKAQAEQDKITVEQNKAEDERVAKAEEARKKLLGSDQAVTKSKKQQAAETKALHEAEAVYTATIEANLRAVQDRNKVQDAQTRTAEKRLQIELEQAKASADIQMQSAKGDQAKIKIQDELAKKYESIIIRETELRQEQITQDEQLLQSRIAGVEQEIAMADRYNLSQAERIRLQAELQSLQTQQEIFPEERAQVELEAMRELQNAYSEVNKLKAEAADGEAKVREEALRTLEVLSSNLEYSREVARGLAEAFGEVGAAIGGMSVAMAEYDKQSATIEIARKEAVDKAEGDQKRITEINDDATKKQAKAQIKAYGDMTQAAQGFFKKGSKGYEAMGAAVKVFRAFEMAQSAMSFVKQLGEMDGLFTSFTTMLTQMGVLSAAETTKEIAQSNAKAVAKAAEGAAQQGTSGDPYTAFARVAAWVALMAGLGIMVGGGGGGGGGASAPPPPETGAGTVFGDPTAVSESIGNSIKIIEENSSNDLNYSADMLDALYQIRDALGGVGELVAAKISPAIANLTSKYGSDAVKQAGFIFRDQKLDKILASGRYEAYIGARVETSSGASMLPGVEIKKGQTLVTKAGKAFEEAFGEVFKAIRVSIAEAGKVIGVTDEQITQRLKGMKIKGQVIDVAGLSAEEAAKKLEAAFSAISDTMATKALPEFMEFRKAGEGYKETIVRVAEGINRAKGSLELLGMTAIDYTQITDKQGDVAAEITRQTIMAQGDLSEGTRKYVKQLQGGASDIIESYKQILNITKLMRGAGFGTENIDRTMINAAGGLSAFEEALQSFRDNFMSDEQKIAAETADLEKAFGKLGQAMPRNRAEFYQMAMAINTSTEEGKKLFAQFLNLNQQFSDLQDATEELAQTQADEAQKAADAVTKAMEEIRKKIDSAMSYQIQITRLLGDEEKALSLEREKAMEGMDDATRSYAQALYKLQDAKTALAESQKGLETAYKSLLGLRDKYVSLGQNLRKFYDELTGAAGPNSSPLAQYQAAAKTFRETASMAVQGSQQALADLPDVSKAFLEASKQYNASGAQYQTDFNEVLGVLKNSMTAVDTQIEIMNRQLAVARMSYDKLGDLDGNTMSVEDAINNMNAAIANYTNAQAEYSSATAVANGILEAIKQVVAKGNSDINNLEPVTPAPAPAPIPAPTPAPPANTNTSGRVVDNPWRASGFTIENLGKEAMPHLYSMEEGQAFVTEMYRQLLGREPESGEVVNTGAWRLETGLASPYQIAQEFKNSPEYQELIRTGFIPGFAKGGMASPGLALVGEQGPELVSFGSTAHVSTANQTRGFFSGIQSAIEKGDAEQTTELQALVRLQSAANQQLIKEMKELKGEMAELARKAKLEAAA